MKNENEETIETTEETTEETTANETAAVAEEKGTGINWAKVAVRGQHGAVDKTLTMALLDEELSTHIAENEVDMEEIGSTVATVFTKLTQGVAKKASIDLNGLATRALGLLGDVPYGQETRLSERIKDFVRGESDRFVESNGASGLYHIKRGKDGGVRLNTEMYLKEYRALQAKKAAAPVAK